MLSTLFRFTGLLAIFILSFSLQQIDSQTFTKITNGQFVNDGGASRSVNFIDYDNDGDLDLYVSNGKRFGQYSFLYNNSGGVFTRVLGAGPVNDSLPFDGASWADFDNDGNIDMCAVTWYDSVSVLYKNNGGGVFTFISGSPIVSDRGFSETCSWGDFDNDGLVDLIVTNSRNSNSRNRLYRNLGSGNFERIDSGAIFLDAGILSRGVNWADIDGDGKLDLFIANETSSTNYMYKNNGGGYFTKITGVSPTTSGGVSWSSSWGDYDNDGDLDLFVANNNNQKNFLFRNDGNFTFTRITSDPIVNENGYYACSGWGDYDNDGDLDMFVTQAYGPGNLYLKNHLYKNLLIESGSPAFERITTGDIVNDSGYTYGFAWADWDADGDLDLFGATTYQENQNNIAYTNNGNPNKWLEIRLKGVNTNRSAIGSKVKVKVLISGIPRWLLREVSGQSGYCGQNLDLHFGLGDAAIIDSVKIEWQSGLTQHFVNIQPNQIINIEEGQVSIGLLQQGTGVPEGFMLYQNYPNPFNPETRIRFDIPSKNVSNNPNIVMEIYNSTGRKVETLISRNLKPGSYEVLWNGIDKPSGVYFCRIKADANFRTIKMILAK